MSNDATPAPTPPPGYCAPSRLRYPTGWLQVGALVVVLLATPGLLGLRHLLAGDSAPLPSIAGMDDLLLVSVTIVVVVLIHELVHGLAYQLLGYRVSYGASLKLLAAYAGAFGQFQQRDHNLLVALAPLLLLNLLLLPALSAHDPRISLVSFTALLFNTAGAVGDLYLAYRLLRLPRATLLYDSDPHTMWVVRPEARG